MILDTLDHADWYHHLGEGFRLAFEYLRSEEAARVEPGRHDLDGDRVFVNVQEYTTRPASDGLWEAHRKYADIQAIVRGRERIGYAPLAEMVEDRAYDGEADVAFYRDEGGAGSTLVAREGMFAIFLPRDVHMPCLVDGAAGAVRKAVAKVLLKP